MTFQENHGFGYSVGQFRLVRVEALANNSVVYPLGTGRGQQKHREQLGRVFPGKRRIPKVGRHNRGGNGRIDVFQGDILDQGACSCRDCDFWGEKTGVVIFEFSRRAGRGGQ
jgi:hypothetical protein